MSRTFVFLFMLFMHVLDDYVLQGVLANLKQSDWWKENAPDRMYRKDYVVALICHAISWSFCIMFPIALYKGFDIGIPFVLWFITNVYNHADIDNLKANRKCINLITDQLFHLFQISITFIVLVI